MTISFEALRNADQQTVRGAIRSGAYQAHTAGLATGYLQPICDYRRIHALDFMRYCREIQTLPGRRRGDTGNP